MPPEREIGIWFDIITGTTPISKAVHPMAPTELRVLKKQIKELLEKESTCPGVSACGAPILLVNKKNGFCNCALIIHN